LSKQREILKKKKVLFYVGYASAIREFSKYCHKKGDNPSMFKLKGIITGAEKLDEKTREISEKVFGCPVLSRYSSLETGILAQECKEEHNFHINSANYYIEILKINSDKKAELGEVGRIVITDLRNYGMPLIRYDIGDLGVFSNKECKCGKKGYIFKSILGRSVENVTNPEGVLVSWVVINDAMWKYPQIKHFQFIQKTKSSYLIKLETNYDKIIEDNIKGTYKDILGYNAKIDVEFVEYIAPLKSGKKPYIINESLNKAINN
jgi:phenylacetate-CoA ligase